MTAKHRIVRIPSRWVLVAAALVLSGGVAAGCAPSDSAFDCDDGAVEPCYCDDGRVGLQSCAGADGWSSCRCGGGDGPADSFGDGADPESRADDAPPAPETDPPPSTDPAPCVADCAGRECGADGCGGSCAPGCAAGEHCDEATGQCGCEPECGGRECGPDPVCGSLSCGECAGGQACDDGVCGCAHEECGGLCCGEGDVCRSDGVCCTPECTGRECGDDGCGGTCGDGCGSGEICGWLTGECVTECACDFAEGHCEPDLPGSLRSCGCDPDCADGTPCSADGFCDTWCPADTDPDCSCSCDYNAYCEPAEYGSTAPCRCDEACEPHEAPCEDDGHCDSWCPAGVDPDCGVDPCRERWVRVGRRYGFELLLEGSTDAPDPDEGDLWALLGSGTAEGTGQLVVGMAAEHVACVDTLRIVAFGYDDSGTGEGAVVSLFDWDSYTSEVLPGMRMGPTPAEHSADVSSPASHLLCGTGSRPMCFVHAEVAAGPRAHTHVAWVEAWAHLSP